MARPVKYSYLPASGQGSQSAAQTRRIPDVVEFAMSPFLWRRHSCLPGRDSELPMSPAFRNHRGIGLSHGSAQTNLATDEHR
jgi:hypothetical protein